MVWLVAVVTVACPLFAGAGTTAALSVGSEYRSGDYGLPGGNIDDVYVPVMLEVASGDLVFRTTVPYAWVEGPEGSVRFSGTVLPGEGPEISEGGIGDVIASLTVQNALLAEGGNVALDLTGTVKLPTADEDMGLGTGETDYSGQVDVYRFLDAGTVYASLGYKVRGEPSGFDIDDTWFASAGGVMSVSRRTSVGASVSYRPELVSSGDPASEATVYLGQYLNDSTRVRCHVLVGLSEASPDWGAGLTLQFRL